MRRYKTRPMFWPAMAFIGFTLNGLVPTAAVLPGAIIIVAIDLCLPFKDVS